MFERLLELELLAMGMKESGRQEGLLYLLNAAELRDFASRSK
jgi:hypothetical protein